MEQVAHIHKPVCCISNRWGYRIIITSTIPHGVSIVEAILSKLRQIHHLAVIVFIYTLTHVGTYWKTLLLCCGLIDNLYPFTAKQCGVIILTVKGIGINVILLL